MTWIFYGWLLCGAFAGVLHSLGIWRTTRRAGRLTALLGMGRLLALCLGFTFSAMLGGILPTAIGWAASFLITTGILAFQHQRTNQEKAIA